MSLQTSRDSPCESKPPVLDSSSNTSFEEHPSRCLEITYPEGGLAAWTVAIGSWCSMTAALGLVNSLGVFQAYVSTSLLPSYSANAIGWIFGIYVFVSYFCGLLIGPIFDARGPRVLLVAGTICTLVGIFTLSVCTEYYQFILAFSILAGVGSSLLFTPAMGAISHWFHARRGTASGFAFTGSGFGGVLFPLMMQSLLPQVGWAWSVRIVGFVLLFLCVVSVVLCKSRLPPKKGVATSWRDMLPDPKIFWDGTGAMAVTTAGVFFVEWAYFVPVTYVPSYYLARQGLSNSEAVSGNAAFAYQLLAILNGASCFGRYLTGYIADRVGRYNTMIASNLLCLVAVMGLWLADALVDSPPSIALMIVFVVLFGIASGANITLIPICVGQLCETQEYGRYYASAYTIASFGCLTGIPIAGNLIKATGEGSRKGFWGVILFNGLSYVTSFVCFFWSSESRLYTFSQESKDHLRKFRLGTSRANDPQAVIYLIDKNTLEIKQDDEKTVYTNLQEIGDDLPDHSPRFVLLSYPLTLPSGRLSVPYVLLYYLPVTCNAELRMLYASAKELMRNTAEVGKVLEIDSADDLEELPQKLGAA